MPDINFRPYGVCVSVWAAGRVKAPGFRLSRYTNINLQGNVNVTLDLANLFEKCNYRRTVNPYLFARVGVNDAFDNDEANALND